MGRQEIAKKSWKVVGSQVVQVIPVDDLREHSLCDCWCEPHDDEGVIVHHSLDGRELYQNGERKPS